MFSIFRDADQLETVESQLAERHRFIVRFPREFVVGHPFEHASRCLGLLVEFLTE